MVKDVKVLLTEDSNIDTIELFDILNARGMKVKCCARNGAEVLQLVKEIEPDVIIMDAFMQHIDGLGVLTRINQMNSVNRPLITILSCIDNDIFQKVFLKEGADYCFFKPVDEILIAERIMQMMSWKGVGAFANFHSSQDMNVEVSEILHQIGIPAKIKGYRYIREAIIYVVENPEAINHITSILYPTIAELYKTDSASVERAMRYAIKLAWDSGSYIMFKSYFCCWSENFKKPTNSEFIARISDDLRYKRRMNMQLYESYGYVKNN